MTFIAIDPNLIITALIASIPSAIIAWSTHKAVNSRMDELLNLAKQEAHAQGTLDEKKAEHIRKGEAAQSVVQIASTVDAIKATMCDHDAWERETKNEVKKTD